MSEAPRHSDPVRRPRSRQYEPAWWETRFPWLLDLLAALDPEPLGNAVSRLLRPAVAIVEGVCSPLAAGLERIAGVGARISTGADRISAATLGVIPLPGFVRDALWIRPRPLALVGAGSAHQLWRDQQRAVLTVSMVLAVAIHVATLLLWPTIEIADLASGPTELEAVELPPEVEIPPPPEQIQRPATPVLATDALAEDVTIAPTTFEDNPVSELPPPPEETPASPPPRPTFTPFTVAPRILNADEIRGLLITEYPPMLREAGIGAEIVMWFYLDAAGGVIEMRIARGSGHEELDAAAFRVAEHIRFSPALNRDEQVAVWVQFPITFTVR